MALNIIGEFDSVELEQRYRESTLENARRTNYIIAAPVVLACFIFIANDFNANGVIWPIVAARLALASLVSALCCLNHFASRWQTVFLIAYVIAGCVAATVLWVDTQRPANFLTHLGVDVMVIMGIFIAVPAVRAQLALAAMFTAGLLILHFTYKEPDFQLADVAVPVSLLLAVFLGASMSLLFNRTRRQLFTQLEVEREMRTELEAPQSRVDELSKLIPMCASCKKIRDDDGYWRQVETYMRETSGTVVSHSICPECASDLYPEYQDKD
ncbi:MAG TPA: hypothetical protein DCM54_13975 [Gammaproteobacteria bacterium]|mgnify:CR=1 FL=1|nr:hypothetical protein [Gammaproteobacteria bacterium]